MIQNLLLDPSFFPVTIVFTVLVIFSIWQNLVRYVPHLTVVYFSFLLFTATSYQGSTLVLKEEPNNIIIDSMESEEISQPITVKNDSAVHSAMENHIPSSTLKIKQYAPSQELQDDKPKVISVQRLVVCENIDLKQRKPIRIREVFIDTTSRIYCFAGLRNPEQSEDIIHVWEFNGEPYAKVHMNVSVSNYFRCWSYITPQENAVGQWSIAVLDDKANVLKKTEFTIVPFN